MQWIINHWEHETIKKKQLETNKINNKKKNYVLLLLLLLIKKHFNTMLICHSSPQN